MATETMNISTTITITAMTCPVCGVHYGLDEGQRKRALEAGHHKYEWYCTNGHKLGYGGESEAEERLAKELKEAQERIESERGWSSHISELYETERKQHASIKGQLTKTRKRANAGTCLDCHRNFVDVAKHRRDKHGDSDAATGPRA